MRIQRLLGILSILAKAEKVTIQELADRFEVSKRTISRDLDTLNCAGIPIVSYPGIGGGISVMDGYKSDNRILSANDTEKIFTALNGLKSIDTDSDIINLMAKLLPEDEKGLLSRSRYMINLSSWFSDNITNKKTEIFHKAICNRQYIRMEYISNQSRSIRIVEPHMLIFKQSYWYLYAFCQNRNDFRLFRLNRVVSYEVLEKQFERRSVNSIELKNDYGANLFSSQYKEGFFQVVLECDTSKEYELTNKIDASFFQKKISPDMSKSTICFFASDLSWTADFVMGIIDKVRIVSPQELYDEIEKRLKKINSYYKR